MCIKNLKTRTSIRRQSENDLKRIIFNYRCGIIGFRSTSSSTALVSANQIVSNFVIHYAFKVIYIEYLSIAVLRNMLLRRYLVPSYTYIFVELYRYIGMRYYGNEYADTEQ